MKSKYRADVAVIAAFALVAVLAMVAPLTQTISPFRFIAVFAGILLGPGALAYRLATGRRWTECLTVGVAINVAAVMMLGLALVSAHFWQPVGFELLIPLTAFLLSMVLLRKEMRPSPAGVGQQAGDVAGWRGQAVPVPVVAPANGELDWPENIGPAWEATSAEPEDSLRGEQEDNLRDQHFLVVLVLVILTCAAVGGILVLVVS
jgi:hypothetical protein